MWVLLLILSLIGLGFAVVKREDRRYWLPGGIIAVGFGGGFLWITRP